MTLTMVLSLRVHGPHCAGALDKFVGDEIMAIFGAPLENKQHAACAIECAQEMMVAHAKLIERWSHRGISPLAGIGIATGEAIVGEMGCKLRTDYTCMGRPINLGSRLCDLAKPTGIRISQATLDAARTTLAFETIEHANITVKGLKDRITIYEVAGNSLAEGAMLVRVRLVITLYKARPGVLATTCTANILRITPSIAKPKPFADC